MGTCKPELEVDDFVEEESSAGGPGEPGRDQLAAVGQESAALEAGKDPGSTEVLQIDAAHLDLAEIPTKGIEQTTCNKKDYYRTLKSRLSTDRVKKRQNMPRHRPDSKIRADPIQGLYMDLVEPKLR